MKTLMKLKEYFKRTIAFVVFCAFIVTHISTFYAMAGKDSLINENLTIQVINKNLNNGSTTILGKSFTMDKLGDLSDGIMLMMYIQDVATYDNFSYSNTKYDENEYIYSKNNVGFYCNEAKVNNIIMAENDINVYCTNLKSDDCTIIYSKNGDINIGVNQMDFNGILYAPNGNININASEVEIYGALICDMLTTSTGKFKCVGTEEGQRIYNHLVNIINDTVIDVDIDITDEDKFKVSYESNKLIEKLDIYLRVDNGNEYEFYMELPESGEFDVDKEFTYLDVALLGYTILGETEKANVESFDIYNDGIEYYYCDTDDDDISDGEEVWFLNTNPEKVDTDEDGFSDYYESIVLCSDPATYTEDGDYDKDGLMNSEEQENGTNPLLRDSDFDGVLDKEDVLQYYCNEVKDIDYSEYHIALGIFDKVTTTVNDDLEIVQTVYNPLTRTTKQYGYGNVVGKMFFDGEERKCAELIMVGDEYRVNTYSYDKSGNIVQIVNNGDIYEYDYFEDGGIKGVYINGKQMIGFDDAAEKLKYANGDEYNVVYDEENDLYKLKLNDISLMNCVQDQYGEMKYCNNTISGVEYSYEYFDTGYVKRAEYNSMFSSDYNYGENNVMIDYNDGVNEYQQINCALDKNNVEVSLLSGCLLSKYGDDNVLSYCISDGDTIIQDTEYVYENGNIVKVKYADGFEYEYEYNYNSQVTKVLENGEIIKEYEYYDNGQLYKENDIVSGKTYLYFYDCYNNLIDVCIYEGDSLITNEKYDYKSELWNDVLSSFDGEYIKYDEIGNPVEYYDGMTLTWNARELAEVNKDGKNITYAYNYEGMRNYKNVDGVETFYFVEGEDVVAQKTDEDIIWYIYDDNNDVFGFMLNGATYYYDKNATKDVIRILDETGEVVCKYTYDAWGNVINIEGDKEIADTNPIRYRSYYYDEDIDMYYLETRFYDPSTRRFVNPDNMLRVNCNDMDYNLYAYCGGDPVNLYDPTGQALTSIALFSISDFKEMSDDLKYAISKTFNRELTWLYEDSGDTYEKFEKWWNSIEKTDLAIINAHGSPTNIGKSKIGIASVMDLFSLEKKNIKLLVLLGCNNGHYDNKNSIARFFANKITGKVVASDGSVLPNEYKTSVLGIYTYMKEYISYNSICDNEFMSYVAKDSDRKNYGWLVFVGKGVDNYEARIYKMTGNMQYKLTVATICKFIDNTSFYYGFK